MRTVWDPVARIPMVCQSPSSLERWNCSGSIFAVGNQYQHPGTLGAFTQFLHAEPECVAHGGTVTGDTRHQITEQMADSLAVHCQGGQHKSLATEDHQADAVIETTLDEAPHDTLNHLHTADLTPLHCEIQSLHGM